MAAPFQQRRTTQAAITGLGCAGLTRKPTAGPEPLAVEAIEAALQDAGLKHSDIDGLLITRSGGASTPEPGLGLQQLAGFRNLSLLQTVDCEGTSAIQMLYTASCAIAQGMVKHIVCVFADTPLTSGKSGHEAFGKAKPVSGIAGLRYAAGAFGGAANYALATQRHMAQYGLREAQLGAVAVSTRAWAMLNPQAALRTPLTLDAYLASRFIVEPLRLFDCAIPVNGAIALVVSAASHCADLASRPAYIHGLGQGHSGFRWHRDFVEYSGIAQARDQALAMAGIALDEINVRELYDAFTFMTLYALESYGFCQPGESGELAASGALGPGGSLPTNTGGGQLSGYYMQGMTPLAEAIIQARGQAGERQCAQHDVVLATNDGGFFEYHACAIISPHASLA